MWDFITKIFDTEGFPARWNCGTWTAGHGWLHILSDLATFGAYSAIPICLAYFILKRKDMVFPKIFWLFCAFIFACGTVHLIEATIFWHPWYRLSGTIKFVTAVVSWATVLAILPVIPKALAMPGLEKLNHELSKEIEERAKIEEQLRNSRDRFDIAIQTGKMGVWDYEIDTQTLICNEQMSTLFSLPQKSAGIPLKNLLDQVLPEDLPLLEPLYSTHGPEDSPENVTYRILTPDKRTKWISFRRTLQFDRFGKPRRIIGIHWDVTDHVLAEMMLKRHSQQLSIANEELEQFAYIASHDLQEPLRKISNFAQLIQEDYQGKIDATADKYLTIIQQSIERMRALIQDLLLYSHTTKEEMKLESIDLSAIFQQVQEDLGGALTECGGQIEVTELPTISGNHTQMYQLFQNLISNAIKYQSNTAALKIKVSATEKEHYWEFTVEDNGIGFEPEYKNKIFQLFERLHSKERYPGTGIGLALCQKIVQKHGGKIWAESTPGKGSRFYFTIPR